MAQPLSRWERKGFLTTGKNICCGCCPDKASEQRHEQGCTHMADGYARVSGKSGVVQVTSGPGATNIVTGLATAQLDSSPVVALTRGTPVEVHQKVEVAIRPENISFDEIHTVARFPDQAPLEINRLKGTVKDITFLGDYVDYRIVVNEKLLISSVKTITCIDWTKFKPDAPIDDYRPWLKEFAASDPVSGSLHCLNPSDQPRVIDDARLPHEVRRTR